MNVAYGVPFEPETWPRAEDDAQCLWDDGSCGPCSSGPQGESAWDILARMQAAEKAAPEYMHRPGTAGPGRVWAVLEDWSYATVPSPTNCMGPPGARYAIIWDSDPESLKWRRRCAPCLPGQVRSYSRDGRLDCLTPFSPIGCDCPTLHGGVGQSSEDEARHARNALIAVAVVGSLAIAGGAYVIIQEARGG